MTLSPEQKSLLWLSTAEIAANRVRALIEKLGSAEAIWQSFGKPGFPRFRDKSFDILTALHSDQAMNDVAQRLEDNHVRLLFCTDPAYPELLRSIDDFPYLLYYAGRLACFDGPMIALVGARKASEYGMEMARIIARGLAEVGVTVVSGLARGIDGAAHQGALDVDGRTIGVLGSGINTPYPPEHTPLLRKIAGGRGLILSEYPLDAEPTAYHFPYRNRIIAGLCQAAVFVEGEIKSGGMHTVNAALTQGREVFAVPGRVGAPGSEGPHTILREGARICTSAQDVLDDLGLAKMRAAAADLLPPDPLQRSVILCLRQEPMTVERLSEKLGLDTNETMIQLCIMEISGLVRREAGNLFSAPIIPGE